MLHDYLQAVAADDLAEPSDGPPWAWKKFTVLDCLAVIMNEEWHHHRYAVRDLDEIDVMS